MVFQGSALRTGVWVSVLPPLASVHWIRRPPERMLSLAMNESAADEQRTPKKPESTCDSVNRYDSQQIPIERRCTLNRKRRDR
jgi:hypothetical protein